MRFLIAAATCVARALYAVLKAVVRVRHKVVFLSRQSDTPSRDFTLLADALKARDPGLEIVIRCRALGESPGERLGSAMAMLGQMYHLATSKACVVDGYVIPVSLLEHRRGLFVVQMWHALGAIKKFGYQTVGKPEGRTAEIAAALRMHHGYDLVLCGGRGTVPFFEGAFGVGEGVVQPFGLPRIDYLLEHRDDARIEPAPPGVDDMRRRFPVVGDPGRTKVLYAPTFRRNTDTGFEAVVDTFSEDRFALLVKPHPLVRAHVEGPNVANVGECDILDVLPLCDAVITDYSAVAFEALAIGLPLYFYVPDVEDYRATNGLNIDPLVEVPEISSRDIDDIRRLVVSGHRDPAPAERLKQRYLPAVSGGCTGRIADVIEAHLGTVTS